MRRPVAVSLAMLATVVAGCGSLAREAIAEEHMPTPASIWLTSEPTEPSRAVRIAVTSPNDRTWSREHTFEQGVALVGSIPLSSQAYRLTALDGACAIDLQIGADREADVLLRLADASHCELVQVGDHPEGAVVHDEPSVLIAPGSVP